MPNEGNAYLSVRLLTYNHEPYILEALNGINIQETDFKVEVVVGDDFSSDNTIQILKNYAFTNPNINIKLLNRSVGDEYFKKRHKYGRLFNFVDTLRNCDGEYVALLDGDDYWTDPLKLQKQVDFLEKRPDIVACFHKSQSLNDKEFTNNNNIDNFLGCSFEYSTLLENFNFITTASVAFRQKEDFKFPKWFIKVPYGDLGLYKLLSEKGNFYGLKDVMSVYRINQNGLYSGIGKIKARKLYLDFYSSVYNALNAKERKIVDEKIYITCLTISNIKYPQNTIIKPLFFFFLKLWYFVKKHNR